MLMSQFYSLDLPAGPHHPARLRGDARDLPWPAPLQPLVVGLRQGVPSQPGLQARSPQRRLVLSAQQMPPATEVQSRAVFLLETLETFWPDSFPFGWGVF